MEQKVTGCFTRLMVGGTALLAGAALLLLGVQAVGRAADPPPVDWAALQQAEINLGVSRAAAQIKIAALGDSYDRERTFWNNVLAVSSLVIPALILGIPAGLACAALDQYGFRRVPLVYPRLGDKVLPTTRVRVLRDTDNALLLEGLELSHETERLIRRVPEVVPMPALVPHTLTLTNTPMPALGPGDEPEEPGLAVPPEELPGPFEMGALLASGWRPSMDTIIQGVGTGNRVISSKLVGLLHAAITGETNKGKTNIIRFFLAQILYAGAQVHLLDTHYADIDPLTGEDWRPIRRRLVGQRPIRDEREIYAVIRDLARGEVKKRLDKRERGIHPGPPIFYVIDELPSITLTYPDFMDHLGFVLREGRKVQVFVIIASQTLLVKTIGGDSGIRTQFQTRIYGGGDAATYAALFPRCRLPEPDQIGLVILKSAAMGQPAMVRMPLVTNETLWALLAPDVAARAPVPPEVITVTPAPVAPPAVLEEGETHRLPPVAASAPARLDLPTSFDYEKDEIKRQEWIKKYPATPEEAARAYQLWAAGVEPARILLELRSIHSQQGVTYQSNLAAINEAIRQETIRQGGARYVIAHV